MVDRPSRLGLPRGKILAHLTELNQAVTLPVNADFEAGFADDQSASPKASAWRLLQASRGCPSRTATWPSRTYMTPQLR
jgi:hypothetical protein